MMVRNSAATSQVFFSQLHFNNHRITVSAAGTVRVKAQTSEMCKVSSILPPPLRLLEIYCASTASHAENKCSTYQRYASALFSANSLYLHCLFLKALEIWRICVVTSQKTVLNVLELPRMAVVSRSNKFTFANLQSKNVQNIHFLTRMPLVPRSSEFSRKAKPVAKNVQGCTFLSVLAGVFCALLASASPISKRLTETLFLKALEILNGIYFSPEPSRRIRTDRDVRGFVRSEFAVSKLVVEQHTGRYAVQQAISKSGYSLWLHYCLCFKFFLCVFYTFFITFLLSLTYTYMNHIPINNPGTACKHKLAARLKGVTL